MAHNTVTKVLQVSEESAPAVHIPVMVGNELFMLTQQDVRRVEDTRHMSYNRITPNQFAARAFGNSLNQSMPATQVGPLQNFISYCQQGSPMNHETAQQTEEPRSLVAKVSKQLTWAKSCGSSSPYPLSYSVGTSTNGLEALKYKSSPSTKHCSCQTGAQTTTKACNTEPHPTKKSKLWFIKQRSNDGLSESSCDAPSETTVVTKDPPKHCSCQTSAHTTSKACNTESSKKTKQGLKKQRSNDSCHAPQDQASETTVVTSDHSHLQRRKPLVPPFCVVSEDYDEQQARF